VSTSVATTTTTNSNNKQKQQAVTTTNKIYSMKSKWQEIEAQKYQWPLNGLELEFGKESVRSFVHKYTSFIYVHTLL